MRREIDKYFSQYLTSQKLTKDMIKNDDTSVMELKKNIIELILSNRKKVFVSSIYTYDSFFKTMPVEDSYTIITHKSKPACILKTLKVETVKFKDLNSKNLEGELKDNDIDKWKSDNIGIFETECREALRVFNPEVPIVIENFELVYN
mgnify:FL=1